MMLLSAKQQGMLSCWTFGLALALVSLLGYSGHTQTRVTPVEQPREFLSGYVVSLQVPSTVFQRQSVEVTIRVRNGQGELLDGVPVVLEMDPTWERDAWVFPRRMTTTNGIARTQFWSGLIGSVQVTARVGEITRRAAIVVVSRHDTGSGS
jgi:hypothetical protein